LQGHQGRYWPSSIGMRGNRLNHTCVELFCGFLCKSMPSQPDLRRI
jgi:hypothetical protein